MQVIKSPNLKKKLKRIRISKVYLDYLEKEKKKKRERIDRKTKNSYE